MSATLLATKLHHPVVRPDLVSRARLVERLDAGLDQAGGFSRKLTLVSAPAGYGKTTLIEEWLRGRSEGGILRDGAQLGALAQAVPSRLTPHPSGSAWVLLDEGDNDPRRFIAYLMAAMGRVDPRIGLAANAMLQGPQSPPSEAVLSALVNDIASIPESLILVLDDYHAIHTPSVHEQLTFFLDHLPPNLHLVITTREDPLLPIPRLRARGQVLEMRQEDLRFTTAETAEFLERVMGLCISSEDVVTLERRTEGWIAGLQLAALSMRGREDVSGFIQAFTGSSRFVLDYLIEEVFERQEPDVKGFLLRTSVLERLSGPLCDAAVDRTGSQALLETLEQANLFIVALDQSRGWYRYHRLFAELLRHRLRATDPGLETEVHKRASLWFDAEGLKEEAIRHALAARDWPRAATLIQSASADLLKRGEVATVIGWFQALPEDALLADPALSFNYCWPLLLAGQYDAAAPLLERVEQVARQSPAFLGEVSAAQAYLARAVGDQERLLERSRRALELLPKSSLFSRGIVALNLGLAHWHRGEMRDAQRVLEEALEAARSTGNLYASLTASIFLGRVFAVRGELHRAEEYFRAALARGGEMPINALAHGDLATLHYEWNELDRSDDHLLKAIAICQRSRSEEFLVGCWILGSRLRAAQGDMAGAASALEEAQGLVQGGRIPSPMTERVDAARAWLLMANGEPLGEWGSKVKEGVDCHPFYRFLGVTRARTLPVDDARACLEELGQVARANEWHYGLLAVRARQTSLAKSQEAALEFLTDALRVAESGDFIRVFVEAGEDLVPVLHEAAARGVLPGYVSRILRAMGKGAEIAGPDRQSLIEPLSERELEVLRLVAAGKSNREIAEKLVVSRGTAKTHVHNLCGKLGVRNRTEAAMRAKELGLV
jgi:ATP/maltotriose-dependent transcriptional regulator MalT